MKNNYKNIEDLFQESFKDFKIEPSGDLWNKIDGKLSTNQFFSRDFKHFNVYYLSVIVVIITTIGLLFINTDKQEKTLIIPDGLNKAELTIENKNTNEYITQKDNIIEEKQEELVITRNENQQLKNVQSSKVSEVIPFTQNQKLESISQKSADSLIKLKQITVMPPRPLFKLENKVGCAPFEVNLENYTEMAQNYEWSFGDGGKSKEKSPTYIYQYPGIYTIQLKASGPGGIAVSIIDSIVVLKGATNKISKSFNGELTEGEAFIIVAKNNQPVRYEWNFGDGTFSYRNNPTHSYSKEGIYTITLRTWTADNCYDSVTVTDAVVIKSNKRVVFPTAFCPNTNGPSDGRYMNRERHNDIFHPVVKGNLENYSLKIYSRTGMLVFETTDVNTGWDGYYQNHLLPEGVYPYIVTGNFDDKKNFQQRGDVTIIYRK